MIVSLKKGGQIMFGVTPDGFFYNIEYIVAALAVLALVIVVLARLVDTWRELFILVGISLAFAVLANLLFGGTTSSVRENIAHTQEMRHDAIVGAYTANRDCGRNDCEPYEHHWTTTSTSQSCSGTGKNRSCTTTTHTHHHERECFQTIEEHWIVTNSGYTVFEGLSLPEGYQRVDTSGECTQYGDGNMPAPSGWTTHLSAITEGTFNLYPVMGQGINYYSAYLSRAEKLRYPGDLPELHYSDANQLNYFVPNAETCGFEDTVRMQNGARKLATALSLAGYNLNPVFVWNCNLDQSPEDLTEMVTERYRRNNMPNNATIFVMHLNANRMIVDATAFTAYPSEDNRLSRLFDQKVSELRIEDVNLFFGSPFFFGTATEMTGGSQLINFEIKWDPSSPVFQVVKEVYSAPNSENYQGYKDKIPVYWKDVAVRVIFLVFYVVLMVVSHFGLAAGIDFE